MCRVLTLRVVFIGDFDGVGHDNVPRFKVSCKSNDQDDNYELLQYMAWVCSQNCAQIADLGLSDRTTEELLTTP